MTVTLTHLGTHWPWGGDLFTVTHPDGRQARVFVDDLGETWVDIRRVPEGGYFHSERVESWRALNGAVDAERILYELGFEAHSKRIAPYAHRVRERGL